MSRRCELTGKAVLSGHLVSHSNRKTKRKFLPNLCNVTLQSDALGRSVRLRISANALRSVEHRGGLDAFLAKARESELSQTARLLKREIDKKRAGATGCPAAPRPTRAPCSPFFSFPRSRSHGLGRNTPGKRANDRRRKGTDQADGDRPE